MAYNNDLDPTMPANERIALYRKRARLTQTQAAQLKGCTVSAWRKWESGERNVASLTDWIEIARILRVRDLFALTGLPVGQLPDDPPESPYLPAVREALFAPPALLDEPVDPERLARSVAFAWETWHTSADNHARLGVMLPELITSARALTRSADSTTRPAVADAAARLWMLLRAWSKWVGAHDLSMIAAERGVAAAADAGCAATEAAAAWNAALMLSTRGWAEESAQVARAAVDALTPRLADASADELAMLGALHLLLAIEYSRLRDEYRMADSIDEAERVAARVGERNAYRTVFGPTNVEIYRASIALDQSRLVEAVRLSERIDVATVPSMERRYATLFALSRAHALRGDDLAASVCLRRAEGEYPQGARTAPAFRAVVRELLGRETPTTRVELRPLADRIRLT